MAVFRIVGMAGGGGDISAGHATKRPTLIHTSQHWKQHVRAQRQSVISPTVKTDIQPLPCTTSTPPHTHTVPPWGEGKKRKDENNAVVSSPSQLALPAKPGMDYLVQRRISLQLECWYIQLNDTTSTTGGTPLLSQANGFWTLWLCNCIINI